MSSARRRRSTFLLLRAVLLGVIASAELAPTAAQWMPRHDRARPRGKRAVVAVEPMVSSFAISGYGDYYYMKAVNEFRSETLFAALMRTAPTAASDELHPFLRKPPFACTPEADQLFTRTREDLAALPFDEFLEITRLSLPERTGSADDLRAFDRRQAALPSRVRGVQKLLAEGKPEAAHDALDELFPDRREEVRLGLARLLLLSTDEPLQAYGKRCLDTATETTDPVRHLEAHLLCGHVALKQRRWSEARLQYAMAGLLASEIESRAMLTEAELNQLRKEAYFGRLVIAEQQGRYDDAEAESRMLIALDPTDPVMLLHIGVHVFFERAYRSNGKIGDGDLKDVVHVFEQARQLDRERREMNQRFRSGGLATIFDRPRFPVVPPPQVVLFGLYRDFDLAVFEPADLAKKWQEFLAAPGTWQESPEEKVAVYHAAAQWHADFELYEDAERYLAEADRVDPEQADPDHTGVPEARRRELLFHMKDKRAAEVLSQRFLADPADRRNAFMLVLTLVESADDAERTRGAKLAALLHRAHPESTPLTIAAAHAEFHSGRKQQAADMIRPIIESKPHVSPDEAYLMARILANTGDQRLMEQAVEMLDSIARAQPTASRYQHDALRFLDGLAGLPKEPGTLRIPKPELRFQPAAESSGFRHVPQLQALQP